MKRILPLALLTLATLSLAGCGTTPTYVNIPAQRADVALNSPNLATVRKVETAALRAVLADTPRLGQVAIELPEGTDAETYQQIASALGEQVVLPQEDAPVPEAALAIEQVRIRGWNAEVDITRPFDAAGRQLVTVYLDYQPLGGWAASRVRPWRGSAERVLMQRQQTESGQ